MYLFSCSPYWVCESPKKEDTEAQQGLDKFWVNTGHSCVSIIVLSISQIFILQLKLLTPHVYISTIIFYCGLYPTSFLECVLSTLHELHNQKPLYNRNFLDLCIKRKILNQYSFNFWGYFVNSLFSSTHSLVPIHITQTPIFLKTMYYDFSTKNLPLNLTSICFIWNSTSYNIHCCPFQIFNWWLSIAVSRQSCLPWYS